MSVSNQHIILYEKELNEKFDVYDVDKALLMGVAIVCGDTVFLNQSNLSKNTELSKLKQNAFKRLGLKDSPSLNDAIQNITKPTTFKFTEIYLAVLGYLLIEKFEQRETFLKTIEDSINTTTIQDELLTFGENFINTQKDIDSEIKKIIDDNIFELI